MNKLLIIGVGGVGLFYVLNKANSVKNALDSISVKFLLPQIHKISISALYFTVRLKVYNPSDEKMEFQIPSIRVLYKESELAFTEPGVKKYVLNANSSTEIKKIFQLPLLTNISNLTDIVGNERDPRKIFEKLIGNLVFALKIKVKGMVLSFNKKIED